MRHRRGCRAALRPGPGRARHGHGPLGDGRPYDVVLGIRFNAFWTGPAEVEVARLRDLVADDDGAVHLWFDLPDGQDPSGLGEQAGAALAAGGFAVETELAGGLVHLTGRPA